MNTKRIDGIQLNKMLKNGLGFLGKKVDYINDLNVFPVADGDTGTNMYKTLESGLKAAKESKSVNEYLQSLSEGMLFGARGNSGVILSQFFKGFYTAISKKELIGPGQLKSGLIVGYRTAYKAVIKPVEGTILTVSRQGIENTRSQITRKVSIETILGMYIAEMKKTLSFTPQMLDVLQEAGVVDSGAYGFICIFEGMLKYLDGEIFEETNSIQLSKPQNTDLFNENSDFNEGYCLEVILQLMKSDKYNQHFDINKFIDDLKLFGTSIVVAQEKTRVKIHIHTFHPARTISLCEEFGVFVDFKLENMSMQHIEKENKSTVEDSNLGIIAAVNGEGFKTLYNGLGCAHIINASAQYNVSSYDFFEEINKVNSKSIILLPNNKNAYLSAEQAVKLSKKENVHIIKTNNAVEGYFSLAMDLPDSEDVQERIQQIKSGSNGLIVLEETIASKKFDQDNIHCQKGDYIILRDDEIIDSDNDELNCILSGLSKIENINEIETCVIFVGKDANEENTKEIENRINEAYPCMVTEILDGQQEIYHYLIGLI